MLNVWTVARYSTHTSIETWRSRKKCCANRKKTSGKRCPSPSDQSPQDQTSLCKSRRDNFIRPEAHGLQRHQSAKPSTISGWAQVSFLSKLACRRQVKAGRNTLFGVHPATNPDFLRSLVSSLHFMRLSLKERRTRGPVQSCVQEIGAIDGCPILRVLREGWDTRISPFNLPRKAHLFLRRPGFLPAHQTP